ncbi:MAG: transposase [Deltaproteobacteria bacterium]|jgi:SRSO17 transposase|nr:transposase [Deltaproteobacteria bacterium]
MEHIALKPHDDRGLRDLPRALQFFMKRSPWSLETIGTIYRRKLAGLVSHGDAMLTVDGCGNPKKGTMSPGVSRMHVEATEKKITARPRDCRHFRHQGFGLIGYRLYMPAIWFSDEYEGRWDKSDVPDDNGFKTRNGQTVEMIRSLVEKGNSRPGRQVGMARRSATTQSS